MFLKYEWRLPQFRCGARAKRLARTLDRPAFIIQLLMNRGLGRKPALKWFLHPEAGRLGDPFQIHDMKRAVTLIRSAVHTHQRIEIYGDYDVDGITATSIMFQLLRTWHADVHYFIPNRFRDGYGPNLAEYRRIVRAGTRLLITVDNGISGYKEVAYAKRHGMDVIITDHHDFPPRDQIPPANAIVMAKYPGRQYHPDAQGRSVEDFCGAGIALKIYQAMRGVVPDEIWALAALGTVADSVKLVNENRVIVFRGMRAIKHNGSPGIRALVHVSHSQLAKLTSTDLSFTLIPRLNALGRMGDANVGVKLLTTRQPAQAADVAVMTEQRNRERQQVMNHQTKEALAQANTPANRRKCTLVLADRHWFPGVVGIIASRVLDRYYKPTIVIGHLRFDDRAGVDRGSGRSIPEFNLYQAMAPLRKFMTSFGGHPMACGLSIKPAQIRALRAGLEAAGRRAQLTRVRPQIKPDLLLAPHQLTEPNRQALVSLAPFGVGNRQPLIAVLVPKAYRIRQMGAKRNHLSFYFGSRNNPKRAVAFGMGRYFHGLVKDPSRIIMAGYLNLNHYRGHNYLQFVVRYLARYRRPIPRRSFVKVYVSVRHSRRPLSRAEVARRWDLSDVKVRLIFSIFLDLALFARVTGGVVVVKRPRPCHLSDSRIYRKHNQLKIVPIDLN